MCVFESITTAAQPLMEQPPAHAASGILQCHAQTGHALKTATTRCAAMNCCYSPRQRTDRTSPNAEVLVMMFYRPRMEPMAIWRTWKSLATVCYVSSPTVDSASRPHIPPPAQRASGPLALYSSSSAAETGRDLAELTDGD